MYVFVFNRPDDFPEIRHFLVMMDARYGLGVDAVEGDFKDGLRSIVAKRGVKAIFLGTRRCLRTLRLCHAHLTAELGRASGLVTGNTCGRVASAQTLQPWWQRDCEICNRIPSWS